MSPDPRDHDRVQVGHISRDVQGGDLADTVAVLPEAADESIDDEAGIVRTFAQPDDVLIGFCVRRAGRQVEQGASLFLGKARMTGQPRDKALEILVAMRHDAPPFVQAGAL